MAHGQHIRRLASAAAGAVLALGALVGAAPAAHAQAVPGTTPNPGYLNQLSGVAAISPKNAWAVGNYCTSHCSYAQAQTDRGMILHWNGTSWSRVISPEPGTDDNLDAVSAASASSVWAAGFGGSGGMILHWNGTSWSQVSSTAVVSLGNVAGVSARSPSDVWAVGYAYAPAANGTHTAILHWNGTAWARIASPNPSKSLDLLFGVSADSAADAWAVGVYCAAHCTSRAEVNRGLALHWNGRMWSRVVMVKGSAQINAVDAISPTDAWAVGLSQSGRRFSQLFMHWNGRAWSKAKVPSTFADALAFSSARNGWAVGGTVLLHWTGRAWTSVPARTAPGTSQFLGASADRVGDAWAVGDYCLRACTSTSPVLRTIALHWNGKRWSRT